MKSINKSLHITLISNRNESSFCVELITYFEEINYYKYHIEMVTQQYECLFEI